MIILMSWKLFYMIGARKNLQKIDRSASSQMAAGFSLMEVIISVALFSVIILSATGIFKLVIDGQRSAIATQNVQESLKYFLEVINKEMRMAQKNEAVCPGIPDDEIFIVSETGSSDTLIFKNYYNQCVTYSLVSDGDSQRFQVSRNSETGFISPAKIWIDDLDFVLNASTSTQALLTVNLRAHALNERQFQSEMTLQTSVASRYYK